MIRLLSLLFMLGLLSPLVGQNSPSVYYNFLPGQSYLLMADKVNLRQKPSLQAKVLQRAPIGSTVEIIAKSDKQLRLKGMTAPWYLIRYKGQKAFVWGGLLALGQELLQDGRQLLYGYERMELIKEGQIESRQFWLGLRLVQNNKELQHLAIKAMGNLQTSLSFRLDDNRGLEQLEHIIELSFSDGYCGGTNGMQTVFLQKQQLYALPPLYSGSDLPLFQHQYFVYPKEHQKSANLLIFKNESGEYDDASRQPKYDQQSSTDFLWNGRVLLPLKP
ncbi:SH3 domain-containing protein [Saprospira grandis DSM 2844]|uniref:SH3 domain-containing protein n=1 Tax=Saprospira grandis DSM 2844 TaxID=694433 RepID=J1I4J9_9BACT|nr:SH3 domain-containing protein [Saprospira grandis]EJF53640.1 SH3 domain-containing protein [Saprospira grandis DSM 2844]